MNILIPDSWLREHLKTKASPKQIAKYLSLCGQSVEKTIKAGDDWVYDIEITTNRPDCLAIYGIARELAAILPRFGIATKLEPLSNIKYPVSSIKKTLPLKVKITKSSLCPRFTASVFDNIKVKPSPKIVQERLEKCGVRAINNVIDISNYLMLELNQPMHTFDYDKIKGAKMILRESRTEEAIVTLDGVRRNLPPGTMVIEDGEGRVIDFCGVMGGKNSAVDENTERVLLFVQTYDPVKIRQECQRLGFHSEASLRFEKGVEAEGVMPAIEKAVLMFASNCEAQVAGKVIDIYPNPPKAKKVTLSQEKLNQLMGIEIKLSEAKKILESLGFTSSLEPSTSNLVSIVPHWRHDDITIPEDLVEEVARIYGYHNLPNKLTVGSFQRPFSYFFHWEEKIKDHLKNWGFTEIYSYSLQSGILIKKTNLDPEKCLKIKNPLNQDLEYMRASLIPSILEVIARNQANFSQMKIFEIANSYIPQPNKLPEERLILVGALTGEKFYEAKGTIEALLEELGIMDHELKIMDHPSKIWQIEKTVLLSAKNNLIGVIGEIHPQVLENFGLKEKVAIFNLDLKALIQNATAIKTYTPQSKYPPIIEDLAFVVPEKTYVGPMMQTIREQSPLIQSVTLFDSFDQTRTFRIIYQHSEKNLTDEEVQKIRVKIIAKVKAKFNAYLKS